MWWFNKVLTPLDKRHWKNWAKKQEGQRGGMNKMHISLLERIMDYVAYSAWGWHEAHHHNADYEVCRNLICRIAYWLELKTGFPQEQWDLESDVFDFDF